MVVVFVVPEALCSVRSDVVLVWPEESTEVVSIRVTTAGPDPSEAGSLEMLTVFPT